MGKWLALGLGARAKASQVTTMAGKEILEDPAAFQQISPTNACVSPACGSLVLHAPHAYG